MFPCHRPVPERSYARSPPPTHLVEIISTLPNLQIGAMNDEDGTREKCH